jgi:hypothetical protein
MGEPGVWHRQLDEYALASAVARCQELLTVLDREHTGQEMHERARAVRVEIRAMAALLPAVELPQVPPLARPSGEQGSLT